MFKDIAKKLVVVVSITDWNEPPRIRHQVTRQLLRKYNVLYVQIYSGVEKGFHSIIFNNGIAFLKLGFRIPGLGRLFYAFPLLESLFGRYVTSKIKKAVIELGYSKATLVNFLFNLVEINDMDIFDKKIFICNDDFLNMNEKLSSGRKAYLNSRQINVCLSSDFIFAVSQSLCDKINSDLERDVCQLLLPGVEFVDVNVVDLYLNRTKSSLVNVAFMGYVDDRLNWDWLFALLNDGRFSITFIGPKNSNKLDEIYGHSNANFIDFLHGKNLIEKLATFDVLTIPYDTSQKSVQAIAISNKFFQYLNSGRPVVISNMPGFIDYGSGVVYRSNSSEQFISNLFSAYNEDSVSMMSIRNTLAKNNSWDNRAEILFSVIDSKLIE